MRLLRSPQRLPVLALCLALLGLGASLRSAPSGGRVDVVVAARTLVPGRPIVPSAVRTVQVDARDAAPSLLRTLTQAVYRTPIVRIPAGAYVMAALLDRSSGQLVLHPGERVLSLRLDPTAAPPPSLLRPGTRVDIVVSLDADRLHPARSTLLGSALRLVSRPRSIDGQLVVALRTTLREAVTLTAAQSYAHDLRLLLRPAGAGASGAVTVGGAAVGG